MIVQANLQWAMAVVTEGYLAVFVQNVLWERASERQPSKHTFLNKKGSHLENVTLRICIWQTFTPGTGVDLE